MKSAADKRVADAETALRQAEAVKQAEENAKHAAQSGTTGTQAAPQAPQATPQTSAQTGTQTGTQASMQAGKAGKTGAATPKFGAAKDAAKSGKLAQTGVNGQAALGLMAVMAVAGAGCVLVKARGKHINRW